MPLFERTISLGLRRSNISLIYPEFSLSHSHERHSCTFLCEAIRNRRMISATKSMEYLVLIQAPSSRSPAKWTSNTSADWKISCPISTCCVFAIPNEGHTFSTKSSPCLLYSWRTINFDVKRNYRNSTSSLLSVSSSTRPIWRLWILAPSTTSSRSANNSVIISSKR